MDEAEKESLRGITDNTDKAGFALHTEIKEKKKCLCSHYADVQKVKKSDRRAVGLVLTTGKYTQQVPSHLSTKKDAAEEDA